MTGRQRGTTNPLPRRRSTVGANAFAHSSHCSAPENCDSQRSCIRQDASSLMQGTRPRACDRVGLYNLAQSLTRKPAKQVAVRELKANLARALSLAHLLRRVGRPGPVRLLRRRLQNPAQMLGLDRAFAVDPR